MYTFINKVVFNETDYTFVFNISDDGPGKVPISIYLNFRASLAYRPPTSRQRSITANQNARAKIQVCQTARIQSSPPKPRCRLSAVRLAVAKLSLKSRKSFSLFHFLEQRG